MPGFVEGYSKIHHDEQRHIGYGTWYLREAVAGEPALGDVVRRTLRDLLPAVAESLTPPDRDGTDWDALGANAEEIRDFAIGGLNGASRSSAYRCRRSRGRPEALTTPAPAPARSSR